MYEIVFDDLKITLHVDNDIDACEAFKKTVLECKLNPNMAYKRRKAISFIRYEMPIERLQQIADSCPVYGVKLMVQDILQLKTRPIEDTYEFFKTCSDNLISTLYNFIVDREDNKGWLTNKKGDIIAMLQGQAIWFFVDGYDQEYEINTGAK